MTPETGRNIEGTLRLDGLIEGHRGSSPDAEDCLRAWVGDAAAERLNFSLEITGDRFSLLADDMPLAVRALGPEPAERIADAIRELIRRLPDDATVFSTLRSTEILPGEAVQTVYLVAPDGTVRTDQRSIDADTAAPPAPLDVKEKLKLAALGLLFAAALFGISALFIDYGDVFRRMGEQLRPLKAEMVTVDATAFAHVFTVAAKERAEDARGLAVALAPAEGCPAGRRAWGLAINATRNVDQRLALEAVYRGYIRCEYFDSEGKYIGATTVRVAGLIDGKPTGIVLPIPSGYPTRLVRLRP